MLKYVLPLKTKIFSTAVGKQSSWRLWLGKCTYRDDCVIVTKTKIQTRKNEGKIEMRKQKGFSLIELLIVIAIILIIAAIAIPNLLRARMAANQASGLSNLRTITTAAITYSSTYGNGYPPDLPTLGGVGLATCNGAILLDDTLTTPPYRKSGYQLNYQSQAVPIPNPPAACANAGF